MKMRTPALVIVGLLMISGLAWTYPTSLNVIPTADMLDPGSMRIEFENDGYSRIFTADSESYWLLEAAFGPRLEFGVDVYDAEDTTTVVNAKYALLQETDQSPAVAFGALDIGEGASPTYYLAAAKDLGPTRLHVGGIGDRYTVNPMLGCEVPVGNTSWLLFDWIGGDENYLTAGIYLETRSGPAFSIGVGFPNSGENSNLALVNVSWTWSPK
jgi:hypothetical protein